MCKWHLSRVNLAVQGDRRYNGDRSRTNNATMNSLVNKNFNIYDKLRNDLYVYSYVNSGYGLK